MDGDGISVPDSNMEPEEENELHCDGDIAHVLHELDDDDRYEMAALFDDPDNMSQHDIPGALHDNTKYRPVFVNSVNCAAHTVQLAVKNALSKLKIEHSNLIKLAREVAKFLRKEGTRNEARKHHLKLILPPLDIETRWSSTYMLVNNVQLIFYHATISM